MCRFIILRRCTEIKAKGLIGAAPKPLRCALQLWLVQERSVAATDIYII